MKQLYLCVGDTYDFLAEGYRIVKASGPFVQGGNTISCTAAGKGTVQAQNDCSSERFEITVFANATQLGGKFGVDKGLFKGKNVIVFGDSITDGFLVEPNAPWSPKYEKTYFTLLCHYLETASNPLDLENVNFAYNGTTLTYAPQVNPAISGVERVVATGLIDTHLRNRNPRPNIENAHMCVIFYGTNDFFHNVPPCAATPQQTDNPQRPTEATTLLGGFRFAIDELRKANPNLKILVLPPLFRTDAQPNFVFTKDCDVKNVITNTTLGQYCQIIQHVCNEMGAKFVDWSHLFNKDNFCAGNPNSYTNDGLHPNSAGHKAMFEFLLEHMK